MYTLFWCTFYNACAHSIDAHFMQMCAIHRSINLVPAGAHFTLVHILHRPTLCMSVDIPLVYTIHWCRLQTTGSEISTSPLAPASEFLKKWLSGKYILVSTCPNRQADFLSSPYIFVQKMCLQIPRHM